MEDKKDIWIIEEKRNPSTDYYIAPMINKLGYSERSCFISSPPKKVKNRDLILIFVRYITKEWIKFVEENKNKIRKIIYFMDDDLFDIKAWKGLPLRYIKKLFLKAYIWKKWLISTKADFFVSTEYLAKKYAFLNPVILPPYPIFEPMIGEEKTKGINLFYFGTDSHLKEKFWLYHIVKEIMAHNKDVIFEIIGDLKVYKRFKDLNRVIVVHPMTWDAYKHFLLTKRRQIGLIPFFNGAFGNAKGYTKLFEVAACGAVGVYSKTSPYEKIIIDKEDGILVYNKKEEWIRAINMLIGDESFRHKIFLNFVDKITLLRKSAEEVYLSSIKRRLE